MQEDWVSTSDIYKLLSDSQRKQFTKMLSYQKDFANECFNNPEMLKEFTEEDRQAIYKNWTKEQKDYFCIEDTLMDKAERLLRESREILDKIILPEEGGQE